MTFGTAAHSLNVQRAAFLHEYREMKIQKFPFIILGKRKRGGNVMTKEEIKRLVDEVKADVIA